jgi:hypothetical protein
MNIEDINFSETLEAGAPSIKYRGDIREPAAGGRMGDQGGNMGGGEMESAEMEGAVMQSKKAIKDLYEALIAQGLSPQEAMEKIKEIIASAQTEEPEAPMMGEEFPGQEFGGGPRAPAAFGGIMDTYTGRRGYGFGSFLKKTFKKAKRAVQKIAKSPIGKAALLYVGTAGLGNLMAGAPGGWGVGAGKGLGWLGPRNVMSNLAASKANLFGRGAQDLGIYGPSRALDKGSQGILGKWGLTQGYGKFMPTGKGWGALGTAATLAPFAMQATGNWEQDKLPGPDIAGQAFDFDYGQMRKDIASAVQGGDYNKFTSVLDQYGLTEGANVPNWGTLAHGAEGGRVGRQEGGLMDLGGRIGYAHGTDRGPLYIDENYDLDVPLTEYEKELREMSKEEREEELRILKLVLQQRGNIGRDLAIPGGGKTGKERQMELLNWGTDRPSEETGYKGDYSMRHRAAEYLDRPYSDEHYETGEHWNKGGRIGRQEGGLMDLGGMEKDYREDGGFVPLGKEEKADDVPARLSRNEFVFTADAVKNAGGGDIDRGAQVMENVMKNLEAGGQVSEESQGKGAQDMFEVSERLSEVV